MCGRLIIGEDRHLEKVTLFFTFTCLLYNDWIPRYRFVSFQGEIFNPHIHKVLLDLMIDSDYDRFKEEYGSLECRDRTGKLVLRFLIHAHYSSGQLFDYIISVFNSFSNVRVEILFFIRSHTTRSKYVDYFFRSNRYNNMNYREISKAEAYDMLYRKPIPGVINININITHNKYLTGSQLLRRRNLFRHWVNVNVNDSISDSPRRQPDGSFVLWEEDLTSPIFICMLIDKIKELIC